MSHTVFTQRPYLLNAEMHDEIAGEGYAFTALLEKPQIEALKALYAETHQINKPGFFFSIFNNDAGYRKKVLEQSLAIVERSLHTLFSNYKIGYSGFVVRGPHDEGEFFMHQDPSFVDETQHAPLHIWCPLVDITPDFAPVCVVPKSHQLANIYRSNSIPFPFENIRESLRPYLKPLLPKAGEAVLLDPRLIHNSAPNKLDVSRPALLIQMFPVNAGYCTPYLTNNQIELYNLPDDYFLSNTNFYENVDSKPALRTLAGVQPYKNYQLTVRDFEMFCIENNLVASNQIIENTPASAGFMNPTN